MTGSAEVRHRDVCQVVTLVCANPAMLKMLRRRQIGCSITDPDRAYPEDSHP